MLPTQKTPPKLNLHDLTVLLHGPHKYGKSTWCAQAEGALFLATEPGLNHLEVYQQPISSWDELLVAAKDIAEGKHAFRTVIIDTVDNAYRMCAEYICQRYKVEHESDLEYGKGYALVNGEFHRVLNKLALLPYGLFLVSHSQDREIETRTGKYTKVVPTLPDKARKLVLGLVDIILFCDLELTTGADGKPAYRRVLRTKPSIAYEAGDRTGRLPEVIDLNFAAFVAAFAQGAARAAASSTAATAGSPTPGPATAASSASSTSGDAASTATSTAAAGANPRRGDQGPGAAPDGPPTDTPVIGGTTDATSPTSPTSATSPTSPRTGPEGASSPARSQASSTRPALNPRPAASSTPPAPAAKPRTASTSAATPATSPPRAGAGSTSTPTTPTAAAKPRTTSTASR
jgi:hypothetical protein